MNRRVSNSRILLVAFAMLSLIVLTAGIAQGQAISGSLTGTVTDASGAAVNGASIEAVNLGTGQKITATTRGSGEYNFAELPVGNYRITVTAANFRTTTLESVPVDLNRAGTANVQLQVGTSATTVEVSGVAPPVDTTTAQLQSTYNETYSKDLGLTSNGQGGGVLNLSMLSPGVTNANSMGLGVGPSVGGQRPRDNNFTVEGVDNNNKSVTGALITIPNDAVENFTLLANQYNSEFGHSSGGQFNTTIKTGTNSFHGSLYEYFRNRNLDAMDNAYVNQGLKTLPRFDSNRYGGTIGGPIVKNKLFFFFNYERNPVGLTSGTPAQIFTPTAAGVAAMATDPKLSQTNFGIFKQYVPVAPASGGAATCILYAGAPVNGPCGAGLVDTGIVSIVPPAFQNYTNFVVSADYNMSEKDQIRFRYVYNDLSGPDTLAQLPVFFVNVPIKFRLVNLSEYHTFTPALLNEFRVGFNRYANVTPVGPQKYPGLDAFPNIVLDDLGGGMNIGPDPNGPQFTIQNFYQFVDNISWTKGKHNWKFGGEYRWYISPQQFTQRSRGDYEYGSSPTLGGTQMFLEDLSPNIIGQRSSGLTTYYGNQKAVYWYANDTWRVTPHFTANLGVRYEYTQIPLGEQRQALNALSSSPSVLIPQVGNLPLIFSKISAPKNQFMPRIGLAYSPGSSGETSIRAGFGMAYDTLYDNIGILSVPPQVGATNNVNTKNPQTSNFLGGGGLSGGGSGVTIYDRATAISKTSSWIPPNQKYPYSINWNLGVQHSFGKAYTAEVGYVGTRGNHLDVQNILNFASVVTPQNALPTYLQAPSQATLNGLPNVLCIPDPTNTFCASGLQSLNNVPANLNAAGFNGSVLTSFIPSGWSTYHALQTSLTRRFSNGLQFQAAYTWSHTIDNSTADFHSTDLTPRRQQDFFNFNTEKATSALSRTNRFTIAAIYDLPYFKSGNWLMKNVIGNWQAGPVYTYESPQLASVQSADDANLNGDTAGDRAIFNPAGKPGTGSDITALTATAGPNIGNIVAYLANDPTAQYIRAGQGTITDTRRNTLVTKPTNNLDFGIYKDVNFTERFAFRLGAQFGNLLNHPQYIPGSNPGLGLGVNDVLSYSACCTTSAYRNFATPGNAAFNNDKATFGSNARVMAIVAKFTF
jgi:Carboxypeptidase regulatory-like domain